MLGSRCRFHWTQIRDRIGWLVFALLTFQFPELKRRKRSQGWDSRGWKEQGRRTPPRARGMDPPAPEVANEGKRKR